MIELDNVAYSYSGAAILSGVSLQLAPGSFHFLTGPSGSGKTTFLKLCYGALRPTEGQVSIFGEDLAAMDRDAVAMASDMDRFSSDAARPTTARITPKPVPAMPSR